MFCETALYTTLDSPKNVIHIPPAACWIPNWLLGNSQEKRVVFFVEKMWCCSCCWSPAGSVPLPDTRSLKVPHWGFFEIQPRWWVILDQALSRGGEVKVIMFPESRRRGRGCVTLLTDHLNYSQNLPNLMGSLMKAASWVLNLKAIMFPEWEREEKGGCRKVID